MRLCGPPCCLKNTALWCIFLIILFPAQSPKTHIPGGRAAVCDGKLSPGEWDDAASAYIPVRPDWKIRVRFKHDDQNLYFLFENVKHAKERLYPEISSTLMM